MTPCAPVNSLPLFQAALESSPPLNTCQAAPAAPPEASSPSPSSPPPPVRCSRVPHGGPAPAAFLGSLIPACPVAAERVPPIAWRLADLLAAAPDLATSRDLGSQLFPSAADPGREVRELMQHYYLELADRIYRRTGRLLIADGAGYRCTADPDAIRHYARTLASRADCCLDRLRALAIALEQTPWQQAAPPAKTIAALQAHLTATNRPGGQP